MAIASMICGIIGFLVSIFNLIDLIIGIQYDYLVNYYLCFISIFLLLVALVFGIIRRKKGKSQKFYKMAIASFLLGFIGIIFQILPLLGTFYNIYDRITYQRTYRHIFSDIGYVITETKDKENISVSVEIILEYVTYNKTERKLNELYFRINEIRYFINEYFSGKYASELSPEYEGQIKNEIIEYLNLRLLNSVRVTRIYFNQFDIIEEI
jgi:flagellar basal body-associated protein FliL